MSENDYCVYARNILTRLDAIGNPTTGFTSDIVRETGNSSGGSKVNMGLAVMGVLVVFFLIVALLKKKQARPQSKLE